MKARKQEAGRAGRTAAKTAAAIPGPRAARWPYALGFLVALAAAFQVYGPSLNGPFLFDDHYLPFSVPNFPVDSLRSWLVGVRPVLMFSYWLNCELSGIQNTLSFHAFNVVFHTANSVLVFFVTRKIMEFAQVERARRRDLAAMFAGALF